jgi:hypothetical protein
MNGISGTAMLLAAGATLAGVSCGLAALWLLRRGPNGQMRSAGAVGLASAVPVGCEHARVVGVPVSIPGPCLRSANDEALVWPLSRKMQMPVSIGLAADNDIAIPAEAVGAGTVSQHHAEIYYHSDLQHWVVRDVGSTNGVHINGVRTAHNLLENGWRISLGAVTLVFCAGEDM